MWGGWDNLAAGWGRRTNWLVPRRADANYIGQFVWMMKACMEAAGISCWFVNGVGVDRLGACSEGGFFPCFEVQMWSLQIASRWSRIWRIRGLFTRVNGKA